MLFNFLPAQILVRSLFWIGTGDVHQVTQLQPDRRRPGGRSAISATAKSIPNDLPFTACAQWVKSENSGQAFNIRLYVYTSAGVKIINYHSNAVTESLSGSTITARIPGQSLSAFANGQWHYIELPVTQTLQQWIPGATVGSGSSGVIGMLFNGKRLFVDDIVISSTRLDRSYQVIPGAAIAGVQGSFTGPNVVAEAGNRVRYFHYNDLGTVMAQTKADGAVEGVWEPDWWGNYRWACSGSPVRPELGLTGKMYDDAAGLYYFNARWYDPERGRWMSEDMVDTINKYGFSSANPAQYYDYDGLYPRYRGRPSDSRADLYYGGDLIACYEARTRLGSPCLNTLQSDLIFMGGGGIMAGSGAMAAYAGGLGVQVGVAPLLSRGMIVFGGATAVVGTAVASYQFGRMMEALLWCESADTAWNKWRANQQRLEDDYSSCMDRCTLNSRTGLQLTACMNRCYDE